MGLLFDRPTHNSMMGPSLNEIIFNLLKLMDMKVE